jgi:hypothetical protein
LSLESFSDEIAEEGVRVLDEEEAAVDGDGFERFEGD